MGQFQDTIYHEHPVVIRDVTASQFAAQVKGAPQHPGIRYRVDGQTEYQWNGAKWVAMVSAEQSVTGGIEIIGPSGDAVIVIEAAAPDDEDGRADGVIYIQTEA